MQQFTLYNAETADKQSSVLLEELNQTLGFVPNIYALVAGSPNTLHAFSQLNQAFSESDFDATERELIQIVVSIENQCGYCVAGHSAFADMQNVSSELIAALRANQPLENPKYAALNRFARHLVNHKGFHCNEEFNLFIKAGYNTSQAMELVLGIALKTFTNILSSLSKLPLDDAFLAYSWLPGTHQTQNQPADSAADQTIAH